MGINKEQQQCRGEGVQLGQTNEGSRTSRRGERRAAAIELELPQAAAVAPAID